MKYYTYRAVVYDTIEVDMTGNEFWTKVVETSGSVFASDRNEARAKAKRTISVFDGDRYIVRIYVGGGIYEN